jgi:hypothetical protein
MQCIFAYYAPLMRELRVSDISSNYKGNQMSGTSVADPGQSGTDPGPDPQLWLTDTIPAWDPAPDPAIFVGDIQDGNRKLFSFLSFFAYYFLTLQLHLQEV